MLALQASPYPWKALDCLSGPAVGRATSLRRLVERAVSLPALGQALGETLTAEASVVLHRVDAGDSPGRLPAAQVHLALADGSAELLVGVEPALACTALARILQRPVHLEPPDLPLDPPLRGALAALLIEVARATGAGAQPLVLLPPGEAATGPGVTLSATVVLDGRPYRAGAWVQAEPQPTADPGPAVALGRLGDLAVDVPVVAGICLAARPQLEQLQPGDAWLCGEGWLVDRHGCGSCALAAPASDRGVAAELRPGGEVAVRGDRVDLALDVPRDNAMEEPDDTLHDAVLDAPIVVRVELGAVSMTAREWARLAPGDVILAERRIADPAVLRVAGREVARGELVDVDGELGVRIQQIDTGDGEP